jgi:hypothetical protein
MKRQKTAGDAPRSWMPKKKTRPKSDQGFEAGLGNMAIPVSAYSNF